MLIDRSSWSGDGDFTAELLEALQGVAEVAALTVEDAPASRAGEGYNFLVNEIVVTFAITVREERTRWLGLIPRTLRIAEPAMTLHGLEQRLAQTLGAADYTDEGMLQYLRTQRVVAPYQTRGYKLVEMVRLYQAPPGGGADRSNEPSHIDRD
jgi:hypothetical protein